MTKIIRVKKGHDNFKFIKWVCLALSKDMVVRLALTRVLFEKKKDTLFAIATHGHSLHRAIIKEMDGYEPGLYEVLKNDGNEIILMLEADEKLKFPDYKKVIPDSDGYKTFDVNTYSMHKTYYNYATCIRNISEESALDLALFKKAESILINESSASLKLNSKKQFSPIIIESNKTMALVMPIRKLE